MKKIILSAVVFLFFVAPVLYAQKARIGFSGGATLAQIRTKVDNTKDNSGYHFGFTLGVMADVSLGKQFSFQPALNFLQKGGENVKLITEQPVSHLLSLITWSFPSILFIAARAKKDILLQVLALHWLIACLAKQKYLLLTSLHHTIIKLDTVMKMI